LKDVWNIAAVLPAEKGVGVSTGSNGSSGSHSGELVLEENFLGICSRELLARGCELLKRTRKGGCLSLDLTIFLADGVNVRVVIIDVNMSCKLC